MSEAAVAASATRRWPLYAGGFLGPFGGAMVAPMLPELRDGLDTTLAVAAANLSVYMVPFAAFMLVSGTLAERWGRRRTVRMAYLAYAAASLAGALAPSIGLFLAARAAQGIANAFTTPVLMAALGDLTPPHRLGRTLGLFGSVQAAGLTFAPVVGGLAAAVEWRWAFVTTAAASLVLAALPPRDAQGRGSGAGSWASLRTARLALACVLAALTYFTAVGITTQSPLLAGDRFGLPVQARGLAVAAFGAAGLLAGGLVGRQADRLGPRRFGLVACGALVAGAVAAGTAPRLAVLVGALALSGLAGLAGRVSVNTLAVRSTPDNRGGAASLMLACQFLGGAFAPVLLVPVYRHHPTLAVSLGSVTALLAGALLLTAPRRWLGEGEETAGGARPRPPVGPGQAERDQVRQP